MRPPHRLLALAALLLTVAIPAAEPPPIPPVADAEPSVSEEEAAVLAEAGERAKSNAAEAAELLRQRDTPEGSAALPFAESVYWHEASQPDRAREALARTLARHPRFHRARLNLAKLHMQLNQHADAARELRALLGADTPDRAEAWRLLAYALRELGQLPAAETAYRHAIAFHPTDRTLELGLLACLVEQEKYAEAVPLARRELGEEPAKRELWALLVNAELAADRREQALRLLECARRLGAADGHMLAMLGDLYLDQDLPAPALACYRQAASLANASPERLLAGFEALVLTRNHAEAAQLAATLAQLSERLGPKQRLHFRALKATLAVGTGDTPAAIAEYRRILAEDPIHGESLLALGDILANNNPAEARELLERAARLETHQIRAWTGLARLAVQQDDVPAAIAFVQRALARRHDDALERYLTQLRASLP